MEALVHAFHDGWLYSFERADKHTASCFGGPLEVEIGGKPFGPKPLHLIARLGSHHIPALGESNIQSLPLIFGMYYDGCDLSYRIDGQQIELLDLSPAVSADDWPYANFPPLLPYVPLRLSDVPRRSSYEMFVDMFYNMPEKQAGDLIVAVPTLATIGLSLWGGSAGGAVTIVFECDLKEKIIRGTSVID